MRLRERYEDFMCDSVVREVMHARLKPIGHRFSYRGMSLRIELDQLNAADRQSPLFGVNRAGADVRCLAAGDIQNHGSDTLGGLASLAKGRKNCGKTNSEGQFGGQTAGTREQKIWTQSHITLTELRDV